MEKGFKSDQLIIPFTYSHTTFSKLKINEGVNLEFDFLGKYILNSLKLNQSLKKLIKS